MTNLEKFRNQLDDNALLNLLELVSDCITCPADDFCHDHCFEFSGCASILRAWAGKESDDD